MKRSGLASSIRVTFIYIILGTAWILASDILVDVLIPHQAFLYIQVQTLKGWLFVVASALLIFGLLQAEERRRQRLEEQYRQLFNSSPDAIFLIDRTGRYMEVNQMASQRYGYSRDQLLNMTVSDLAAPELRDEAQNYLHTSFMLGRNTYNWRHKRKDGSTLEVEIRSRPVEWHGQVCMMNTVIDITDQIQYHRTLEESERRYRTLFQDSPTPLLEENFSAVKARLEELKAQGISNVSTYFQDHPQMVGDLVRLVKVLDVNEAVTKLYNANREDLISGLDSIFNEKSLPAFAGELSRIAQGERHFDIEVQVQTLQGEERHTIIHWSAAPGFEASLERVYVAITDITEREQIEENLRQSNERLETLIQASPLAIYTLDLKGRVLLWNPASERMFGWKAEEVLGKELPTIPSGQQSDFEQVLERVFAGETFIDFELERRRKDGSLITINLTAAPTRQRDSFIDSAMSMATDITERKRLQSERTHIIEVLQESEQRFRRLVDSNIIGVIIYETNGNILEANEAFMQMTGYEHSDLPLNWYQLTPAQWSAQDEFSLAEIKASGVAQPIEKEVLHKLGHPIPVLVGATRLEEPDQVMAFVLDLSEAKEKEDQLRASVAEKEILLREVHHRVKNNLEVIVSLAELQTLKITDPAILADIRELQERVRTIALVHENLYRSENLEQIHAQTYLEKLTSFLFISFGSAEYELLVEADDVIMDIEKAIPCGLIVNELVTNAFKHAFPHRPITPSLINVSTWQIHIALSFDGERYLLEVQDNGVGLPENLDPLSASTLGLRLVNLLSMQLHGELEAFNANGAHFRLVFPKDI